ncbi:putative nuclease HARBI1 [Esox lucius]|uniref:DDE Tnp4 domain-containing protein n=1 Tax=Esox lucius TaxID=8010 RepID=A0A3P8XVP2_ESOLU|nr:putative nuclease HARBI1 [Esox lucius]XP_012990424.2 putative nuclease HARBI1 [Esox lucius]XP_019904585.2 putative nuclease HARBI1 [Esox lucius]
MESSMKKALVERRSRLKFLSMRRRETIRKTIMEKQMEIQRHIRRRMYILNNMKRCLHTFQTASNSTSRSSIHSKPLSPLTPYSLAEIKSDWWERVVMEFQPQDWLNTFHLSKDTFYQLYDKLRLIKGIPTYHISLEKCVAVLLLRLATNLDYHSIGDLVGTSSATVVRCIQELCNVIVTRLKPFYIHHPNEQELEEMATVFNTLWGFPHCVGVIDSLHISVKSQSRTSDSWNSKEWPSVVVQGVVNGHSQFWDVRVGFPGSTDDWALLQGSELWTLAKEKGLMPQTPCKLMGQPLGYVLLGDAAFPLQSWLLKCYPESSQLTPQQRAFNGKIIHARTPIEGTFRRLKARWLCLKRNNSHAALIPLMTQACCVLHNMCERNSDPCMEKWLEETSQGLPQPSDVAPVCLDDSDGEVVRSLLCDYFHQLPESQQQGSAHPPTMPLDLADPRPGTHSECSQAVNVLTALE